MQDQQNRPTHRGTIARVRRAAVPLALIFVAVWLLVGCLYLPSREKVSLTGTRQDFRELPGYDAARQPHVAGRFTRQSIEAVLGRPPYVSDNRRRAMYVIHIKSGVLIAPLCFTARDQTDKSVGLVLTYDESGRLAAWRKLEVDWSGGLEEPYGLNAGQALQQTSETLLLSDANYRDPNAPTPTTGTSVTGGRVADPDELKPNKAEQ
jgi:hypothetical protein